MTNVPVFGFFHDVSKCATIDDILEQEKDYIGFTVEKVKMKVPIPSKAAPFFTEDVIHPTEAALIRTDKTGRDAILGSAGVEYGIIQNRQTLEFCSIFQKYGAKIVSVFAPNFGEKLYVMMKQPDFIDLGPNDKIDAYFCVSTTHDGSGAFRFTPLYLHRHSQLVISVPTSSNLKPIKHSKLVHNQLATAQRMMGALGSYWEDYSDNFQAFSTTKVTDKNVQMFLGLLVPKDSTRSENIRERIFDIYKNSGLCRNLASCKGTLLGAIMAVMENADHHLTVKKSKLKSEDAAFIHSRIEGSASEMKAKSIRLCVKLHEMFKPKES